jgi:hypothetical protein
MLKLLSRYIKHFSSRPGKCNKFEYAFRIEGGTPQSSNTRHIPCALRHDVRKQIAAMVGNGILEESYLIT